MGILNKTLDELAGEMEIKVNKALIKIKSNQDTIDRLKHEIKTETQNLAQLNLDEESAGTSPTAIQKKIRQLRYELTDAEELAEAYENMAKIITEKDKRKISDAYQKERETFDKESNELYQKHTNISDEIYQLQLQLDEIYKKINWRSDMKPGEAKVEEIMLIAARVDSELGKALNQFSIQGSAPLISDWLEGNSLEKYIPEIKEGKSLGKMRGDGSIEYY